MRILIAATALLLAAAPGVAQSQISASKEAAIRELLQASATRENFILGMELGMEMGGAELTPELRRVLREFMDDHFRYEDLEPEFIRIYGELFTEEDVRAMTAFYRTPAGQRMVQATPRLTAEVQKVTAARMQELMPDLMERVMQTMQDDQ